jgi:SAM-dependent methyltransferase
MVTEWAMTVDLRTRAYGAYNSSRSRDLTPTTAAALGARGHSLRQVVREHFPTDRAVRVLDLGCGHGALLHFAAEAGYRALAGVDSSPEQVAAAHALGVAGVTMGDAVATIRDAAPASLDVVVTMDLIEHFTRDELVPFAEYVARALRPGGRWIIHTPNGESPFFGGIRYGDITHEMAFTRRSLAQFLALFGFGPVHSYEDTPVVHGAVSLVRGLVWRVVRSVYRLCLAAETGIAGGYIFSQNFTTVAVKPETE